MTEARPDSIGRFRIDAVLGQGGMGAVYKAFDPTLQRTVALKTVRPDVERPDFLERLLREAQACARLRHRNVVTVYEAGELDGLVYIVMEYLDGEDLGRILRGRGLSFTEKIDALQQVLEALQHSHQEGVIHRDIKPSNVHRGPDGVIKVVDFGLARVVEASPLTQTGALMCTPDYASPEQLRDQPLDHRTDIYSTGALAYEMFTGRRPFQGETGSLGALIARALSEPLPPMRVLWVQRFPEIERIVTRAMAKAPAERYQTADEMRADLAHFMSASGGDIARVQAQLESQSDQTWTDAETVMPASMATQPTPVPATASAPRTTMPAPTTVGTASTQTAAPDRVARNKAWWRWVLIPAAVGLIITAVRLNRSPAVVESPAPVTVASEPAAGIIAASANTAAPSTSSPPPPIATAPPEARDVATAGTRTPSNSAPASAVAVPPAVSGASALFAATTSAGASNPGLRYRIIRRGVDGVDHDVDSSTVFRSGDRVRFAFDANIDGHLYVVLQGSTGRWTVLFPGPQINGGQNRIRRGEEYLVPGTDWFRFDATPGVEQIFVFLSREPSAQLPGFDRPISQPETVLASVVEDLQTRFASRDLVFEKNVASTSPSGATGQATYVVNRKELGQAVAAMITLTHTP